MAPADTNPNIPENLFHTLLTVVDLHKSSSGGTRSYFVLGTHGTLRAAKAYSMVALRRIDFHDDDFLSTPRPSRINGSRRGGSRTVAARRGCSRLRTGRLRGRVIVSLETTPNNESLCLNTQRPRSASTGDTGTSGDKMENEGALRFPDGARFLHYVLQTTIDYNADRSGSVQTANIEGAYVHRADAWTAAHRCLLASEEDEGACSRFAEYDFRGDAGFISEWPFDEDVAVHAVAETGQNSIIAVKTPPHVGVKRKEGLRRVVQHKHTMLLVELPRVRSRPWREVRSVWEIALAQRRNLIPDIIRAPNNCSRKAMR